MSQEINKTEHQDLALIVRAIGTDLEHTQVRLIASCANTSSRYLGRYNYARTSCTIRRCF